MPLGADTARSFVGYLVVNHGSHSWRGHGSVMLLPAAQGGSLVVIRQERGPLGHSLVLHRDAIRSTEMTQSLVALRFEEGPEVEFHGPAAPTLAEELSDI